MTTYQANAPITQLRQRMQQDMVMRGLGAHTQQDYVRHVRNFAAFLGRPPDSATAEDIRHYQLHQHETGVGPATINSTVSALRFLFTVTLNRRDLSRTLVITRNPRKLPDVLSVEEAARLLEAAPGIKYKAALGVAYGAGLRVSEVAHLKIDDIDSTRMLWSLAWVFAKSSGRFCHAIAENPATCKRVLSTYYLIHAPSFDRHRLHQGAYWRALRPPGRGMRVALI